MLAVTPDVPLLVIVILPWAVKTQIIPTTITKWPSGAVAKNRSVWSCFSKAIQNVTTR